MGLLQRFKDIKTLLLNKLDSLDSNQQSILVRLNKLEKLIRSQLENENSLMQSSIHIIESFQKYENSSHIFQASRGLLNYQKIILLGNPIETSSVRALLPRNDHQYTEYDWDWDDNIEFCKIPMDSCVVICKLPVENSCLQKLNLIKKISDKQVFFINFLSFIS
jgi:hypothetical protein